MKYTLLLLLLLLFSVKNSFAVDSLIWINYRNMNNQKIISLKECIKKENIYINKIIEYDKNSKNITAFDHKFKLYEYYNSSIEIYFYNNGQINYDTIIYYYAGIKKEKFKNIFNKNDMNITYMKKNYLINYNIKDDALIILTPDIFTKKNNKRIRVPLSPETNSDYNAILAISKCLKE